MSDEPGGARRGDARIIGSWSWKSIWRRTRPWRRHRRRRRWASRPARRLTCISAECWCASPTGSVARSRRCCCGRTCDAPLGPRGRRPRGYSQPTWPTAACTTSGARGPIHRCSAPRLPNMQAPVGLIRKPGPGAARAGFASNRCTKATSKKSSGLSRQRRRRATRYPFNGRVERISENFPPPVPKRLMERYPLAVQGFHSDNGSG